MVAVRARPSVAFYCAPSSRLVTGLSSLFPYDGELVAIGLIGGVVPLLASLAMLSVSMGLQRNFERAGRGRGLGRRGDPDMLFWFGLYLSLSFLSLRVLFSAFKRA